MHGNEGSWRRERGIVSMQQNKGTVGMQQRDCGHGTEGLWPQGRKIKGTEQRNCGHGTMG